MAGALVLGLGNILLGDEGVGVRVVERLREQYDFSKEVQVMDGGTLGLDLLPYVQDTSRLLVVDAVQAKEPPGTLVRLASGEIPIFLDACKVSAHQEGLQDFWGVQINSLRVGLELSPVVAEQVDFLAKNVVGELARWGFRSLPRSA
jgi:hydrogenase maturation protease